MPRPGEGAVKERGFPEWDLALAQLDCVSGEVPPLTSDQQRQVGAFAAALEVDYSGPEYVAIRLAIADERLPYALAANDYVANQGDESLDPREFDAFFALITETPKIS